MSNSRLSYFTATVALAGFLFGFDTIVISGANLPIRELWPKSPIFHGTFIMSMALWGTVLGALTGGMPTNKYGRKKTLFIIGILYGVSALGSALAQDPYTFSLFRFVGGIGVGISSVSAPTYISEISPKTKRGRLVIRYQFMIVFGILIAFISNYLLKGVGGENDWRFMLGVEAIPALIYTILVLYIPESPRWLILKKNDEDGARKVFRLVGNPDIEKSITEIKESIKSGTKGILWRKIYITPIMLAFFVAFFNQMSGINFTLYYAPEILERAGLASKESLLNSISLGLVNLVFTLIAIYLIDRRGRKQLLLWGAVGYIISLIMVSWAFYTGASSGFLLVFICLFVASHAIGQGAVIWVFISEIFPNNVRAYGQALGAGTHWVLAAIVTLLIPVFLDKEKGVFGDNPWPIFAFFAVFMIIQLAWIILKVPETKGKSLEQIGRELSGK